MKFKKQLVPYNLVDRVSYSGANPIELIIIHQTGNRSKGANAQAHADIQSRGNTRKASWHESIDDEWVIQSFEHTVKCWHSGASKGNTNGIGLELCINSDGDYKKTIENGARRTAQLMKQYNIPLSNVLRHYDCSGKICPRQIMENEQGISWTDFKNMVKEFYTGKKVNDKPEEPKVPAGAYEGNSIVEYLNSIGKDSSFNARKEYAKDYGVHNYNGTANDNLTLLERMREGAVVEDTSKDNNDTANTKWTSLVDYLNYKGADASFDARAKLAKANGIGGYKGTAQQNIDLLNKLVNNKISPKPVTSKPKGKSIEKMAEEVIDGKHGNGHDNRRKSLGVSQSVYNKVRDRVNKIATGKSAPKKAGMSIEQMANKIINDPKAPQGHTNRRKWLGVDQATYNKVRNLVNRKL